MDVVSIIAAAVFAIVLIVLIAVIMKRVVLIRVAKGVFTLKISPNKNGIE